MIARVVARCLLGSSLCVSTVAGAQNGAERLSDWLLRQNPQVEYPIGLSWRVPQEKSAQESLKRTLLQYLEARPQGQQLQAWIQAQAVTGRVVIANTDPRWLQAHPNQDPLVSTDQALVSTSRPAYVTVLLEDGRFCQPLHRVGATAKSYVDACLASSDIKPSRAWIAQPDGRVFSYGIDVWNAQPQTELAPGAWIWAPQQVTVFSDAFSDGLIRLLGSLDMARAGGEPPPVLALPTSETMLRSMRYTASDWGEIGLLQTPTARMKPGGEMRFQLSHVSPYTRGTVMFQPFDWLEAGFRYTDIANRPYDDSGAAQLLQTDQSFKDKSLDFKIRLRDESSAMPALAMGVRDVGGTGLFSGEYLVANKRWGDWDASLGLGWGNLGARGNITNPLGRLDTRMLTRPNASTASGGEIGANAYFRGPSALFGGVQWRASQAWTLKLELDGNNYQHEPLSNPQAQRSPWNWGANYQYSPTTDFSVGWERGNKLMVGMTLSTALDGIVMPKLLNPAAPKFASAPESSLGVPQMAQDFALTLKEQTGWKLIDLADSGSAWQLKVEAGAGAHRQERLERLNGLVQSIAPERVMRWDVQFINRGLPIDAIEINRSAWVELQTQSVPLALKKEVALAHPPHASVIKADEIKDKNLTVSVGPSYSQILGGPNAFLLYKLGAEVYGEYRLNPSTWVEGSLDFRVADNYSGFKYTAPSNLPRVRTYVREYVTSTRSTIPLLQATHVASPATNHYASVYAGMLESMFAGVGAEWLYRPWRSPLAFGVDVNHVVQRDFKQNFQLRDYQVNTGHASAYWDTGISGLLVKLQMGQYLAGDRGATIDVSRRFNNGVVLGAYATKTNVSAQQFGEGSFDKGIYLTIPFDVMLPKYSNARANLKWQPLTRDGGARLTRNNTLYDMTSGRDPRALEFAPSAAPVEPTSVPSALSTDAATFRTPAKLIQENTAEPVIDSVARSGSHLSRQLTHPNSTTPWLWGAGAVLGAMALDKTANRWALNHTQQTWVPKLGNAVPLMLGLAAMTDLSGDGVGPVALKSAGFTLAANELIRVSFGRARPEEERGSQQFDPFQGRNLKSSFASNHAALAFALATPFAQTYDMPWLYGAATITAVGRVQARQHWLSDTVAGGVLGYAIGSVLMDEHREQIGRTKSNQQLLVSPSGIATRWWWN